jgi:fused signal recognition particle receptor
MQTSKNLMDEMSKIVRVVKPDSKLFIGDALAGNDTINQAREFFQYSNFDGAILTKIDADAKGGAAISIAHITSKPIAYVGIGQGYDDIIPFEPDKFIESLFGSAAEVRVEDLMSAPRPAPVVQQAEREEIMPSPPTPEQKEEAKPAVPISSGIFAPAHKQDSQPAVSMPLTAEKPREVPKEIPAIVERKPVEKKEPEPVISPRHDEMKPVEQERQLEPKQVVEEKPSPREEPKEKKPRFGGFFKKKSDEERKQDEEKKRKAEEKRTKEEEERVKAEEEERKQVEKEKEDKKRKEDKDTEADKVIYLTDEDIEDLLK